MKSFHVKFLPDRKAVRVKEGSTILDAALAAGVPLNNGCLGEGHCGKCRAVVKSGKVESKPHILLTKSEVDKGIVLACQTAVQGDVVVEVPLTSRAGGVADVGRFGRLAEPGLRKAAFARDPLALCEYLELPEPGPSDNLSDAERVKRELDRRGRHVGTVSLGVLRELPNMLRKNNWKVTAVLGYRGETTELIKIESGNTCSRHFGAVIDIGTTTVVTHLVDLNTLQTVATRADYNSQISMGDDVIARIMSAGKPERRLALHRLVVGDINDLLAGVAKDAGIGVEDITYAVCAGNTTMTHLLLGVDPSHIRRDPYVPGVTFPPVIRAVEIGVKIDPNGLLLTIPCVSSYVGGDVVADVLMSGMTQSEDVSLLIDIGTNGELVIGNSDWLVCSSASAGPAFEGGGISCGMRATHGAVEHIRLGAGGEIVSCDIIGDGKPAGLCGSGLIDAVGELLGNGCIDRGGHFMADKCGSRLRESGSGGMEFLLFHDSAAAGGRDIVLTESDINNLIHTKGSIYMAAECLLKHVDLTFDAVKSVYIAGGFGNYLDIERAVEIGLLPDIERSRFHFIGNGSVQGATMALMSRDALKYLNEKIAGSMTDFVLSSDHKYMNEYSSCLFLPHTDLEKFPSQKKRIAPRETVR